MADTRGPGTQGGGGGAELREERVKAHKVKLVYSRSSRFCCPVLSMQTLNSNITFNISKLLTSDKLHTRGVLFVG